MTLNELRESIKYPDERMAFFSPPWEKSDESPHDLPPEGDSSTVWLEVMNDALGG